jgi:hypothetical protein
MMEVNYFFLEECWLEREPRKDNAQQRIGQVLCVLWWTTLICYQSFASKGGSRGAGMSCHVRTLIPGLVSGHGGVGPKVA